MYTGTISDLDREGGFGLIDGDEGDIFLFHPDSTMPPYEPRSLRVGERVTFSVQRDELGAHAVAVAPERPDSYH